MKTIPCSTCLIFPRCKSKYRFYDNTSKLHFLSIKVFDDCIILKRIQSYSGMEKLILKLYKCDSFCGYFYDIPL